MRTHQFEISLIVVFKSIGGGLKPVQGVAFYTILCFSVPEKIALVVVFMTIGTTAIFELFGEGLLMALFTVKFEVFALKWIIGLVVVKAIQIFNTDEGVVIVTFQAICSKFSFVLIFMAICAFAERDSLELLKLPSVLLLDLVTFYTGNSRMLSQQREFGLLVMESTGRLESFQRMTLHTISTQGFLVVILMTGKTICLQTQIGGAFCFFCYSFGNV